MRVTATTPQKTELINGTKASTAASAVRITGRERWTVASTTASKRLRPARSLSWICPMRMSVLRINMPDAGECDQPKNGVEPERLARHQQRGDDADQAERGGQQDDPHS